MECNDLSIKELKKKLTEIGIDHSDCIEKQELIDLYVASISSQEGPGILNDNFHFDDGEEELQQKAEAAVAEATGVMSQARFWYSSVCDMIIRPPRAKYRRSDLGPVEFTLPGRVRGVRDDFALHVPASADAPSGHHSTEERVLQCSLFHRKLAAGCPADPVPCVVYLHGNAGCRLDAVDLVPTLLGHGFAVCAVDLSGCGMSTGKYVSLGAQETDDMVCLVRALTDPARKPPISRLAIWGRSMGAVTALLYSLHAREHRQSPIPVCLVLDSPFCSLNEICHELAGMISPVRLPRFAVAAGIRVIRSSVQSKAGFDIYELNPVDRVDQLTSLPVLFGAGRQDDFVSPTHSERLFERYGCPDKHLVKFKGDHNSARPPMLNRTALRFLLEHFHLPVPADLKSFTRQYYKSYIDPDPDVDSAAVAAAAATDSSGSARSHGHRKAQSSSSSKKNPTDDDQQHFSPKKNPTDDDQQHFPPQSNRDQEEIPEDEDIALQMALNNSLTEK